MFEGIKGAQSRRSLLRGVLGGAMAATGAAIARVSPVQADGATVKVGGEYRNAHSRTFIKSASGVEDISVLGAESRGLSPAIVATAPGGWGAIGFSGIGPAVTGVSMNGVGILGVAGTDSAPMTGGGIAVYARGLDDVLGLRTSGRIWFERRSGVAVLRAGTRSVSVHLQDGVTKFTFVIVSPTSDPGARRLWATASPSSSRIVIHASSPAPSDLSVAWFAPERSWTPLPGSETAHAVVTSDGRTQAS